MIPTIGIMIGFYIITKMLDMATREKVNWFIRICAVITIFAAGLGILLLFVSSNNITAGIIP